MIDAKRKCQKVHRDISVDNIILVRTKQGEPRTGILADWELSTKLESDGRVKDEDNCVSLI